MRLLAIDSATDACSVALFDDGALIAGHCEVIGRGHAERLVPMIASLPDRGRAARIAVALGPGSFTGVRIGLAAARALGLAWQADVVGYPTLALVAAMAQAKETERVSVAMRGGHGEWFVQDFGMDGLPASALASLVPEMAVKQAKCAHVAGGEAEALVALRGHGHASTLLPDARCFPRLPDALITQSLTPLYGRPPDARPAAERP